MDAKLREEMKFTDMRMTIRGYQNGGMGGGYFREPVPRDSQQKRQNALEFLGLFTHKSGNFSQNDTVVSEETPSFKIIGNYKQHIKAVAIIILLFVPASSNVTLH
ncbi:hypothetical protein [Legionella worsleiensis]|uniref:Uncharacterized protein n=1 Tax=Legionella worsleiensis TaxID=45076 RepID=A0A0W1A3G6_9GAMM|nr:hypothetical protein [Legionella worsleiensis]KTD75769.1 hypothetical protein Lwor_2335 [Legionella worsleiensis]STY32786.1 Uncharacterised protein [Legionella worsleiensis]